MQYKREREVIDEYIKNCFIFQFGLIIFNYMKIFLLKAQEKKRFERNKLYKVQRQICTQNCSKASLASLSLQFLGYHYLESTLQTQEYPGSQGLGAETVLEANSNNTL